MINQYEDFMRYAKLTAYDQYGNTVYETDLGQRLRFEISKTVKSAPNHCTAVVYAIDQEEASSVLTRASSIILQAGENEDAGTIFRGSIVDGFYKNDENPHLQLSALDGDSFFNSYISLAIGKGETLRQLVLKSAAACSSPIAVGMVSASADMIRLPRGCVLFGATTDVMDDVAKAINAAWFVNDERLYVLTETDMDIGMSFIVNVEDDLVSVPVHDAWSCAFSHRIDSRVILGSTCSFDDPEAVIGTFRVVSVDIIGDTLEGDWRMNVWALRQEQGSPAMTALTRNIWR